jgi:hypothetical protein
VLINECGLVTPVPRRLADRDGDRRGHSLVIDSGWREVADTALSFVQRFIKP